MSDSLLKLKEGGWGELCIGDNPMADKSQGVVLRDLFIYILWVFACLYVCTTWVPSAKTMEEGVGSPGSWVSGTVSCLPAVGTGNLTVSHGRAACALNYWPIFPVLRFQFFDMCVYYSVWPYILKTSGQLSSHSVTGKMKLSEIFLLALRSYTLFGQGQGSLLASFSVEYWDVP